METPSASIFRQFLSVTEIYRNLSKQLFREIILTLVSLFTFPLVMSSIKIA